MSNAPKYPNGMPASLRDVWDIVDQLGMTLKDDAEIKAKAQQQDIQNPVGLSEDKASKIISERNRHLTYLVTNHGDKLKPQARYTVVTKEKNERGRHFRKGEFRLFIGEYSAFIIELDVTPDGLDIDPKKMRRVLQIVDDAPFRNAKTADERKDLVKDFIQDK